MNNLSIVIMIENINSGYVALIFVGIAFFALQIWWIGMTIRNGMSQRGLKSQNEKEDIKKRLEKIFVQN